MVFLVFEQAAGLAHTRILEYLLTAWPDSVTETDFTGKTPLHWASCAKNNSRAYNLLVQAGADEEALDYVRKPIISHFDSMPTQLTELCLNRKWRHPLITSKNRTTSIAPSWRWCRTHRASRSPVCRPPTIGRCSARVAIDPPSITYAKCHTVLGGGVTKREAHNIHRINLIYSCAHIVVTHTHTHTPKRPTPKHTRRISCARASPTTRRSTCSAISRHQRWSDTVRPRPFGTA